MEYNTWEHGTMHGIVKLGQDGVVIQDLIDWSYEMDKILDGPEERRDE